MDSSCQKVTALSASEEYRKGDQSTAYNNETDLERTTLSEASATDIASIWFLSSMHAHVLGDFRRMLEGLPTFRTVE